MSSLLQPPPMLSSHFSSPYDVASRQNRTQRDAGAASPRDPLSDLSGNFQTHKHNGMLSCFNTNLPVPSLRQYQPSIPVPVLPSQSLDLLSCFDNPGAQQQIYYQGRLRTSINPLYFWPAFRRYRNRQARKDTEDNCGVWHRPELEDAFLDAILLMPHLGRRKFAINGKLHGRNMLISEYIFAICVVLLGSKEIFRIIKGNESIEQMGRKQVSSHMQVVKRFFVDLRCFHFLFPSEETKRASTTNPDDPYDRKLQESFKSNPVLTALAERRVPDVKPNYEYFSTLLTLQSGICVRPKTCEIFVSWACVKPRDDATNAELDTLPNQASDHHADMHSNDDRPNHSKEVLLHEYTRTLDRTASACAKSITRRWQQDSPTLYETLLLPSRDEECLLLEMCATLALQEHTKSPSGAELTGFVEFAITQPTLRNHRWKCVTRLASPARLHRDPGRAKVYANETEMHGLDCNNSDENCHCHSRPRTSLQVPFPAAEWVNLLRIAAQYPDIEHQRMKDKQHEHAEGMRKKQPKWAGNKRKRSEAESDTASRACHELTGSDLICNVAMYQELWSCAPNSSQWTRQSVIFWRFKTTKQWHDGSPVFKPAGTTWRWLTINDPMSCYHKQNALVYPQPGMSQAAINAQQGLWTSGLSKRMEYFASSAASAD